MREPDPLARGIAYGLCVAIGCCWPLLCAVVFVVGAVLRWW